MKTSWNLIVFLLIMSIFFYPGCGNAYKKDTKNDSKVSLEDIEKETPETDTTAVAYLEQEKKIFQEYIGEKIEQLEPKIEALKDAAKKLTDDAGAEMNQQIQRLEKLKDHIKEKLTELNKKGFDSVEKSQKQFLIKWEELKKSYDSIVNEK